MGSPSGIAQAANPRTAVNANNRFHPSITERFVMVAIYRGWHPFVNHPQPSDHLHSERFACIGAVPLTLKK